MQPEQRYFDKAGDKLAEAFHALMEACRHTDALTASLLKDLAERIEVVESDLAELIVGVKHE